MAAISKIGKTYIGITAPLPYEIWNPKSVDVMMRMDDIFLSLVKKLTFNMKNDEEKFLAGVQLYIFTGAMFEAWANFRLWATITNNGCNGQEGVFKLIEKNSIYEKLDYMAKENNKFKMVYFKSQISDCIDMRNRLMHFKDKPLDVKDKYQNLSVNTVDGKVMGKEVFATIIDGLPNAPIYNKIVDVDLEIIKDKLCLVYANWNDSF